MCLFQKKVNKHKIYDKRFDIYERAVTFDGPDLYSADTKLGGKKVSREIKRIFLEIRNNIRQLSQESILIMNMNIYLKIGQDGNFWLELLDHIKINPTGMNNKQKL